MADFNRVEQQNIFPEILWESYKTAEKMLVSTPDGLMTTENVLHYFQKGYDFYATQFERYSSQEVLDAAKKLEFEKEVQDWKEACSELALGKKPTKALEMLNQKIQKYKIQVEHAKKEANESSHLAVSIEETYVNAFIRARNVVEKSTNLKSVYEGKQ